MGVASYLGPAGMERLSEEPCLQLLLHTPLVQLRMYVSLQALGHMPRVPPFTFLDRHGARYMGRGAACWCTSFGKCRKPNCGWILLLLKLPAILELWEITGSI